MATIWTGIYFAPLTWYPYGLLDRHEIDEETHRRLVKLICLSDARVRRYLPSNFGGGSLFIKQKLGLHNNALSAPPQIEEKTAFL